jgi:hypothetical protein
MPGEAEREQPFGGDGLTAALLVSRHSDYDSLIEGVG